jgi:hypothetical protein
MKKCKHTWCKKAQENAGKGIEVRERRNQGKEL